MERHPFHVSSHAVMRLAELLRRDSGNLPTYHCATMGARSGRVAFSATQSGNTELKHRTVRSEYFRKRSDVRRSRTDGRTALSRQRFQSLNHNAGLPYYRKVYNTCEYAYVYMYCTYVCMYIYIYIFMYPVHRPFSRFVAWLCGGAASRPPLPYPTLPYPTLPDADRVHSARSAR